MMRLMLCMQSVHKIYTKIHKEKDEEKIGRKERNRIE